MYIYIYIITFLVRYFTFKIIFSVLLNTFVDNIWNFLILFNFSNYSISYFLYVVWLYYLKKYKFHKNYRDCIYRISIDNRSIKLLRTWNFKLTPRYSWLLLQFTTRVRRRASQRHHSHLFFQLHKSTTTFDLTTRAFFRRGFLFRVPRSRNEYIHHA